MSFPFGEACGGESFHDRRAGLWASFLHLHSHGHVGRHGYCLVHGQTGYPEHRHGTIGGGGGPIGRRGAVELFLLIRALWARRLSNKLFQTVRS